MNLRSKVYLKAVEHRIRRWWSPGWTPYPKRPVGVNLDLSRFHAKEYRAAPLALSLAKQDAGQDVGEWQEIARAKLRDLLGPRWPSTTPQTIHCREDRRLPSGLMLRQIFLRPIEDWDILINLLWCEDGRSNGRTLVYLPGSTTGVHHAWSETRYPVDFERVAVGGDMARQAAERGYLVAAIEIAGFGEREERALHRRSAERSVDAAAHALMLGRTLLGERVNDTLSVVDWLSSRDPLLPRDVDPARLDLFGHSSGGTVAAYAGALDQRFSLRVMSGSVGPLSAVCGVRPAGNAEATVPGIALWLETGDVIALHAPRPVILVSGEADHIYPFREMKVSADAAKPAFAALNAEANLKAISAPGRHGYKPKQTWPVWEEVLRSLF